jgi:hypothetical protein
VKVYAASEVSISFGLIPIDGGRGDDEFVSWSKQEESFTYKAGVDGEGTRSDNKNNYFIVKLTLMASSAANAVLSAIHNGDVATPGGLGVVPILIRDRQGTSLFAAPEAWIIKHPDRAFGKEIGTVEWEIGVHSPTVFTGGN